MFKLLIFLTICYVGVFGLPQTKQSSKYPKKYDKEVHGTDAKVEVQKVEDSSYLNYSTSDQMEAMSPPSEFDIIQDANYDLMSSLPQFSQDEYSLAVDEPQGSIVPPSEDSYSRFNGDAMFSMLPPQQDGQSSDAYLGYADVYGDYTEDLKAPGQSSYSEVFDADTQYSDGLSPPAMSDTDNTVPESSYLAFEQPSSYDSYDNTNDQFKMDPPPATS